MAKTLSLREISLLSIITLSKDSKDIDVTLFDNIIDEMGEHSKKMANIILGREVPKNKSEELFLSEMLKWSSDWKKY